MFSVFFVRTQWRGAVPWTIPTTCYQMPTFTLSAMTGLHWMPGICNEKLVWMFRHLQQRHPYRQSIFAEGLIHPIVLTLCSEVTHSMVALPRSTGAWSWASNTGTATILLLPTTTWQRWWCGTRWVPPTAFWGPYHRRGVPQKQEQVHWPACHLNGWIPNKEFEVWCKPGWDTL